MGGILAENPRYSVSVLLDFANDTSYGRHEYEQEIINCPSNWVFVDNIEIVIATCLSVRPSVRLSVTRWYCFKTKKASGMISSSSGSPKTLVF